MYKIAEHILYEDDKLLVCVKQAGIAVQTKRMGEQDMESLLRNYLAAKGETPFIGIIHRLDQPVEGVMVFGKTKEATAELNRQMQKNGFGKYYLTVVYGKAEPKEGQLIDFLKKDGRSNTSSVVKQGTADAKRAALTYRVLECSTLDDRDSRDGKAASGGRLYADKKENQLYHRRGEHRVLVRGSGRVPGMQPPRPFLAGKLGHMACGGRAVCGGDGRMQRIGRAKKVKRTNQKRESGRFRFPFLSLLHRFRLRSAFSRWLS